MATDATGTPTSLGIPTYDVTVDAPSGNGNNAQMQAIDALIQARIGAPSGIAAGEVPVWNGTTWVRSSVTPIGPSSLGTGTRNGTKFLRDDGTWVLPGGVSLSFVSNQLSADVTMTSSNQFYDGPSASFAAGTWLLIASVLVTGANASANITAKLWDGSTVLSSTQWQQGTNNLKDGVTLVAVVTPGGTTTYKVSVASDSAASSAIKAAATVNGAGNNASTLVGVKIA